jgi:hypothetical protein
MKRSITSALVTGILCATAMAALTSRPVVAAEDGQAALKADQSLLAALGKSDKAAVGALLDAKFQWTDAEGKTLTKAEVLNNLSAFAADNEGDTDVKVLPYSQLGIVYGFHHNARFGRIWVKRPAGWRAFVFLDTPIPKQTSAGGLPANNTGDCDNPCRTLPFKPTTAVDKAVLAEWQKTKMDEWHPDATDWESHVADEFLIINDRSERNKPVRVAFGKKLQEAGISAPGDPITSMTMSDFGDTVVMISHHVPYRGGKPYYNDRVFVHRNGHWLIAWSQQTTNQAASPVPPVATSK